MPFHTSSYREIKISSSPDFPHPEVIFICRYDQYGGVYNAVKQLYEALPIKKKLFLISKQESPLPYSSIPLPSRQFLGRIVTINFKPLRKYLTTKAIIHIHFLAPSLLPVLLLSKSKKVITFHNMLMSQPFRYIEGNLAKRLIVLLDNLRQVVEINIAILLCDHFIFLTKAQYDNHHKFVLLRRKLENNNSILPNCTHNEHILKPVTIRKNKLNVLFVGQLTKLKGFDTYLKVASKLKHNNRVRFHIIGSNPFKKEIPNLPNINYLGELENSDVVRFMKSCDILVLLSLTEACPMSILEAISNGLTILVSDIPGMETLVKQGYNGFLLPNLNRTETATSIIIKLANNNELLTQLSQNSLKKACAFNSQEIAYRHEKLYKNLVRQPDHASI